VLLENFHRLREISDWYNISTPSPDMQGHPKTRVRFIRYTWVILNETSRRD